MEVLRKSFPPGLDYQIIYNPTEYISQSIDEVYKTLFEALVLVVIVVIVFLQSWRAAIIPILAIPVSLVGTFAVMLAAGFTLNNLSLFGLVLAIGIVVDDAIVVVENVERHLEAGHDARARRPTLTMDEVGRRPDRHRAGAVVGFHSRRLHSGHLRPVLSAVRPDHRHGDGLLADRVADPVAGHGRAAAEAEVRARRDTPAWLGPLPRRRRRLQPSLRPAHPRLRWAYASA